MKQQVNDITEVLRGLSAQIGSMQGTIGSQHDTICKINRTSQGQLKEIKELKRMLKKKDKEIEELRQRLSKYGEPPKNSGNSSTPPSKERMGDEIIRRTNPCASPRAKSPEVSRGMTEVPWNWMMPQTISLKRSRSDATNAAILWPDAALSSITSPG